MKKFRKIVSLFLLVVMVFNYVTPFMNVSAIDTEPKVISNDEFKGTGDIELEVELVLPIEENVDNGIKYQIKNSKNQSAEFALDEITNIKKEKVVTLGSQEGIKITATKRGVDGKPLEGTAENRKIVYYSINIYGLEVGEYKVGLVGNNFVDYLVPVTLKDYSKRVSITNENGMFTIGDINNDEKVDDKDLDLMLNAVKGKGNYDLNCDGVTDIADLNYITASINSTKKSFKTEDTNPIMDSSKVTIEVPTDVEVEGELSSIFTDSSEVVTLKPKDNQEVSEKNPINLVLDLAKDNNEPVEMSEIKVQVGENKPEEMSLAIEYVENGKTLTKEVKPKEIKKINGIEYFTDEDTEGAIVIDLGSQIAVKKVTIKVTKVGSNKLADIAKVEFLNNVKMELSEPDGFYVPQNIKVDESVSEQLTVTFDPVTNVTGYEISINGPKKNTTFQTTFTNFTIEDLENYKTYKIKVQAVNGEWESGFSEAVSASPKFNGLPPSPDMVNVTPDYSALNLSWKDMKDTLNYYVYYRVVGTQEWTKTSLIDKNSYALKGLKDETEYEVYITGNNPNGEGSKSQTVRGKTLGIAPTITPKYKLINTKDDGKTVTNHIKDVIYSLGTMVDGDKYSIVDDNFKTYFKQTDWTMNAHYVNMGAPIIVLDNSYQMNEFILTVPDSYTASLKKSDENDLKVHYWEGVDSYQQATRKTVGATLSSKKDENNRTYYIIRTYETINANAIQFGLTATGSGPIEFNEVKIYKYDSLLDDVANLFTDDLRLELADGVNQSKIDELRSRADIKDNNEYNPYRDVILADLKYAEDILNDKKLDDVITLDPNYSNSYVNPGFAMTINDYQPLGVVAKPGDKLTIYVGSKNQNPNIQVVFSQFYAEAGTWNKAIGNLKVGQNIIDVPKIGDAEAERGGSVYIRYTSKPNDTPIKVRVSGGVKIPVLDTTYLKDEISKKEAIKTYINELDSHINAIKKTYGGAFKQTESVLNSTEIVTRQGLFSVPATAVLDAINSKLDNIDDKVSRVYKSTEAFDEMIDMFYRHKGLDNKETADATPKARINIRYMRMFYGAFMYAGGYHIGIEYGSVPGLVQAEPNTTDKTGYFGWGISHEVGHQINQGTLAKAEVTNNVFALLAQTSNDKDKSRLEVSEIYPKIYEKVTSHTAGRAQNVFVQLGMYWQLHLAYDDNKTFEDTNSIFARINKEARRFDNSTKKYSSDDLLILFASKAANKDLTEFFEIWGLRPTDAVKAEIASLNLEKETRPIWYLNDEARRFRLNQGTKISDTTKLTATLASKDDKNKEVTLNFNVEGDKFKILGYEIIRNGVAVAFVEGSETSYVDKLGAENNRAYTYQIVAYDYLLNKTNTVKLDEIKISYDGSLASKDTFSIESNVKATDEIVDLEDSDMDYDKLSVNKLIDGDSKTGFIGLEKISTFDPNKTNVTTDNGNAYVIINLNADYSISGIKYQALTTDSKLDSNTISKYKISVSKDKVTWQLAKEGTFNLTSDNNYTDLVYFMKPGTVSNNQLYTFNDIAYVKIESVGKTTLSGLELDVIAPPGDNIELDTIGVLDKDYTSGTETIKAGSVIIKGEYRGDPAFNIVTITDAFDDTKVYDGYQLLFAEVEPDKHVYSIAKGTWMFVMTKEEYEKMLNGSSSIRANLYRANNMETDEDGSMVPTDERITSTSKAFSNLRSYSELEKITITDSNTKGN